MQHDEVTLEGNTVRLTQHANKGVRIEYEAETVIGPDAAPAPQDGWPYNTESFWRFIAAL